MFDPADDDGALDTGKTGLPRHSRGRGNPGSRLKLDPHFRGGDRSGDTEEAQQGLPDQYIQGYGY